MKTLIHMLLALLTACGGGGDSSPVPTETTTESPPTTACETDEECEAQSPPLEGPMPEPMPRPVDGPEGCFQEMRVMLNGDSTMWGWEANGGGKRADVYPELALQRLMDLRFGKGVVQVRTGAVSGATSGHALLQPTDADLVVYNPGINDVVVGHSPDVYKANLQRLAQVPGAVFQTPLPVSTHTVDFSDEMRQVAATYGLPIVQARAYALQQGDNWWEFAPDGVHLTSAGYEAIARWSLYPVLEPIIAHKLCDRPVELDTE